MTSASFSALEYGDRLASVMNAYSKLGYDVVSQPSKEVLPDFLRSFQPDLIARKPGENLIVQLKNRVQAKSLSYWLRLEQTIQEHPDWKLQLIDPGSLDIDLAPGSEPTDNDTIKEQISQAEQLLSTNNPDLAVVVAFGALEAAMRAIVVAHELSWDHINVLTLIATLLDAGYFDQDDVSLVRRMMEKRNAIVHGFSGKPIDSQSIGEFIDLVNEVIGYI